MSKYHPLTKRLTAHGGEQWDASFSELESVLGFALPKAARTSRTWWINDPAKGHSRAWAAHGWEVGDVDHAAERVVFRRGAASGIALVEAAGLEPLHPSATGAADLAPEPPRAPPSRPDAGATEVQPAAMREAAETASAQMHATRQRGNAAIVAAAAGVGLLLARRLLARSAGKKRRKK